jgi:hypothetical protein
LRRLAGLARLEQLPENAGDLPGVSGLDFDIDNFIVI